MTATQLTTWTIDPAHSNATFAVRHMMVTTVRGHFSDVSGTISFDTNHPEGGHVSARIGAATITTRDDKRDGHLKSDDFLAVDQYPEITFESTAVRATGTDEYEVDGNLTIRDVTKPLTLTVEAGGQIKGAYGEDRLGFEATTKINRQDYGLKWQVAVETGGVLVGDEVKIGLDISATAAQ